MSQNQTESKPASVEEPRDEGLDETTCCASSDTPRTDEFNRRWLQGFGDYPEYARTLERALWKFMAVTETSDEGITQMATIESRVKFYERLRTVRAEAYGILSHNVEGLAPATGSAPPEQVEVCRHPPNPTRIG
jgi:hypothetical protein